MNVKSTKALSFLRCRNFGTILIRLATETQFKWLKQPLILLPSPVHLAPQPLFLAQNLNRPQKLIIILPSLNKNPYILIQILRVKPLHKTPHILQYTLFHPQPVQKIISSAFIRVHLRFFIEAP